MVLTPSPFIIIFRKILTLNPKYTSKVVTNIKRLSYFSVLLSRILDLSFVILTHLT